MAGRFARSLDLARAAWSVVRADKELMLLPVLSVAVLLLILGSLAVPVALLGGLSPDAVDGEPGAVPALGVLVFYIVAYFVTLFFNTALVGAAMIRMDGGNPRLGDGLRIAWERAGRILRLRVHRRHGRTAAACARAAYRPDRPDRRQADRRRLGAGDVPRRASARDARRRAGRRGQGERGAAATHLGREPDRQPRPRLRVRRRLLRARDRLRRDPGAGGPDRPAALHFTRPAGSRSWRFSPCRPCTRRCRACTRRPSIVMRPTTRRRCRDSGRSCSRARSRRSREHGRAGPVNGRGWPRTRPRSLASSR